MIGSSGSSVSSDEGSKVKAKPTSPKRESGAAVSYGTSNTLCI